MFIRKCSIQFIRDVSGITPSSVRMFAVITVTYAQHELCPWGCRLSRRWERREVLSYYRETLVVCICMTEKKGSFHDHKADNQNYLVKLEVNRSNIVSSNSSETEKSMFPGTTKNNTFIMVEQTSNHSSYSWVHRKQISCNEKAQWSWVFALTFKVALKY